MIHGRILRYILESILRENLTSEAGFTAVKFENLVVKFINKCFIFLLSEEGILIALTLGGKPSNTVSLDTLSQGQIRMNKGAKKILAITCMNSGHLTLGQLQI